MANRDIHQPDIISERIELRPALSSTGDVPVFLSQPESNAETETESPATQAPSPEGGSPEAATEVTPPVQTVTPETPPKPDPRTVRLREAGQRIATLEGLLEQAVTALTAAKQPPVEPTLPPPVIAPPADLPRPARADFDDPESYDAALVEWASLSATRRAISEIQSQQAAKEAADQAAREQADAQKSAQERQAAVFGAFNDRRAKFVETHPDYAEVVEAPNDLFVANKPGTPALIEAILAAENGPEVAYYLAQNRDQEARLTAMTNPTMVLIEVGGISAALKAPKPPEVTRTPPPITPVGGGNALAAGKSYDEMSTEEYARATGRDTPQYRPFLSARGGPRLQ